MCCVCVFDDPLKGGMWVKREYFLFLAWGAATSSLHLLCATFSQASHSFGRRSLGHGLAPAILVRAQARRWVLQTVTHTLQPQRGQRERGERRGV